MKGIVWKELREWGPLTGALLLVLCLAWCLAGSATGVLIAPRQEATLAVIAAASFFGLALGYGQLDAERVRRTLPYLAHREGGKRALLRGKLAVGVPLALAVGMLPPLVFLVQQASGPLAAVVQPGRALEHALAGLAALPAYASGLFIALVAPSMFQRFALGVLAVCGCLLYSLWLPLPIFQMSPWAIPLFALGELALAAAVLALAWSLFAREHDRDAVLPLRLQAASALVALLLVVFPGWWAFSNSVAEGRRSLFDGYPLIVHYRDGHHALMERREYETRARAPQTERIAFTLPDGTVAADPNPALVYNPAPPVDAPAYVRFRLALRERSGLTDWSRWQSFDIWHSPVTVVELRDRDGAPVRVTTPEPTVGTEARTYFDRETGTVRQFRDLPTASAISKESRRKPSELVLARPDGKAFSRETILVLGDMALQLLVDRRDGTLWVLDHGAEDTSLVELSLPDRDRLVDLRPGPEWYPEGWQGFEPARWELVGANGSYQWTASGFVRSDTPAAKPWWLRYCRSEVGETSLAEMTVRLREVDANGAVGPESEVAYVQHYEPRRLDENARVALMRFGMLCGPPVSSAPLLRGLLPGPAALPRDFAGFHVLHVLLGLALAGLTWRHVARRAGTLPERALWSVFVLLFGVFALCFLLMLAPRPWPATDARAERAAAKPSAEPLPAT